MARSLGGGSSSGGGGRSLGGGGRSTRSFSGSGRSYSGGSTRRTSSSSSSGSHSSSYSRSSGYRRSSGYSRPRPNYGGGLLGAGIGYMLGSSSNGYSSGYRRPARRASYGGGGCASVIGYFVVIVIALTILSFIGRFGISGISGSSSDVKLNKEKYTGEVYTAKGYYEDHSTGEKWIDGSNENTLISGMKSFYQKTGVFPFLYIVDTVPGGSTEANIGAYEDNLYEELFSDRSGDVIEGNLLILFVSDKEDYFLVGGLNTSDVIDASATKVITDKINARWSNGDLAYIFGDGLSEAAKSIMAKSNGRVIAIAALIVAGAVGIVFITFKWWKARVAQKNKEQEDLEKILSKPLDTFGNQEITDLRQKYEQQQQSMR